MGGILIKENEKKARQVVQDNKFLFKLGPRFITRHPHAVS